MSLSRYLQLAIIITFTMRFSAAATFLWSTNDPTYGLLQGTAAFSIVPDSNTSDCGATTCYSLQIILSNTSTNPANQSSQVLEGVFFDIVDKSGASINTATGMLSAVATGGRLASTGTTIVAGSIGADICGAGAASSAKAPLCATVSSAWESAYSATGFTVGGSAYAQHYGIGDAGWGLFQGSKVGNPINGIVPGVGIASNPNSSLTKNYPFVYGTATFVLYGLKTQDVTVQNVRAAYGTAPEAAESALLLTGSPEPGGATLVLLAGGVLGSLRFLRKRKQKE